MLPLPTAQNTRFVDWEEWCDVSDAVRGPWEDWFTDCIRLAPATTSADGLCVAYDPRFGNWVALSPADARISYAERARRPLLRAWRQPSTRIGADA